MKRACRTRSALAACVSLYLAALLAQAGEPSSIQREYRQRVWTTDQGLPNNTVRAILQTRDGYLWIATQRGLARFDGIKFTVFNHLQDPAFVSDDCTKLAEDSDGNLWIATQDGLLCKRGPTFTRYVPSDARGPVQLTALLDHPSSGFWIGSVRGLFRFRDGTFTRFGESDGFPEPNIIGLCADHQGGLWVGWGDPRGLYQWNPQSQKFDTPKWVQEDERMIRGAGNLACDRSGNLWFENSRLLLRWCEGHLTEYGPWAEIPAKSIGSLLPDQRGAIWFTGPEYKLWRFHEGRVVSFDKSSGLSDDRAFCVYEDREGNLWIGTEEGGLNRWQPRPFSTHTQADGLAEDRANTILESRDGSVWIGTEAGITRIQNGRFSTFRREDRLQNRVRAMAEAPDGRLWFGTIGGGLLCHQNGPFTNYTFPGGYEANEVRSLSSGRDGSLWVGTVRGLHRLRLAQWSSYTTTNGLPQNEVRTIHEDRFGNLWIGTLGGGLARIDRTSLARSKDFELETLTVYSTTNGLSNNNVWALHEDSDGVLWIGTERGLNRLKNGRLTVFTAREGLHDDLIGEILEDDLGQLWIGCDRGIYRVAKRDLNDLADGKRKQIQSIAYDETDGLLDAKVRSVTSQPSACKMRDGRLWFPTFKGVVVIDPKKLPDNPVPPPVVIEQVRANDRMIFDNAATTGAPSAGASLRESAIRNLQSPILLPPGGAQFLEIHYTANHLAAPERVRFKYRMEGLDKDWREAGARRVAYYTNLRPGNYRFQVIACNSHDVWSATGAAFSLFAAPFYWQTRWFQFGAGLSALSIFALIGWGIHHWRLGFMRRIHDLETQQALAQERRRIARDLHDEIGSQLSRLAISQEAESSKNFNVEIGELENPSHEPTPTPLPGGELAKQPFNKAPFLGGVGGGFMGATRDKSSGQSHPADLARQALRSLDEVVWATDPQRDTLEHLVDYVGRSAREYLEGAKMTLRLDLSPQIPSQPLKAGARHNIVLALKETLANAVKHSGATQITLRFLAGDARWSLAVEDDGCGFNVDDARDAGNGLQNMRERVEETGGRFLVQSQPGQGTLVLMEWPWEKGWESR